MSDLQLLKRTDPDAFVIYLAGDLDAATVPLLDSALALGIESGLPAVRVDLDGLLFDDRAGLQVLAEANDALSAHGRTLWLSRPRTLVQVALAESLRDPQIQLVHDDVTPPA